MRGGRCSSWQWVSSGSFQQVTALLPQKQPLRFAAPLCGCPALSPSRARVRPCRARRLLGSALCWCPGLGRWLLPRAGQVGAVRVPSAGGGRAPSPGRVAVLMSSPAATTACAALSEAAPAKNEFLVHPEQGCWAQPRAEWGSCWRCGRDRNPRTGSDNARSGIREKMTVLFPSVSQWRDNAHFGCLPGSAFAPPYQGNHL